MSEPTTDDYNLQATIKVSTLIPRENELESIVRDILDGAH